MPTHVFQDFSQQIAKSRNRRQHLYLLSAIRFHVLLNRWNDKSPLTELDYSITPFLDHLKQSINAKLGKLIKKNNFRRFGPWMGRNKRWKLSVAGCPYVCERGKFSVNNKSNFWSVFSGKMYTVSMSVFMLMRVVVMLIQRKTFKTETNMDMQTNTSTDTDTVTVTVMETDKDMDNFNGHFTKNKSDEILIFRNNCSSVNWGWSINNYYYY